LTNQERKDIDKHITFIEPTIVDMQVDHDLTTLNRSFPSNTSSLFTLFDPNSAKVIISSIPKTIPQT
jgi:hypothetical protein